MLAYIARRLLLMVPTLFGIMVVNFIVVQAAPGGPGELMIARIKGQAAEATPRGGGPAPRGAAGPPTPRPGPPRPSPGAASPGPPTNGSFACCAATSPSTSAPASSATSA